MPSLEAMLVSFSHGPTAVGALVWSASGAVFDSSDKSVFATVGTYYCAYHRLATGKCHSPSLFTARYHVYCFRSLSEQSPFGNRCVSIGRLGKRDKKQLIKLYDVSS